MKRMWVVCYDVADDRRRARLDKWLSGQGDRVLESVFECVWRAEQLPAVQARLAGLIDAEHDALSLTPVCHACREAAVADGQHRAAAHPSCHIV